MPSLVEESDGQLVNAACPTACLSRRSLYAAAADAPPVWQFHSKVPPNVTDVLFSPLSVLPCFSSDSLVEKEGKKKI